MGVGACCHVVCTWLVQLLVQFPPPVQWVWGLGVALFGWGWCWCMVVGLV